MGPAINSESNLLKILNFAHIPTRFRTTVKELFYGMLAGKLPPGEPRREIATVRGHFTAITRFLRWLDTWPTAATGQPAQRLDELIGADLQAATRRLEHLSQHAHYRGTVITDPRRLRHRGLPRPPRSGTQMTPTNGLPSEAQVRHAFTKLLERDRQDGHRPSVLALAHQFGLSNTTFRLHYPEIVKELAEIRRTPAIERTDSPAASEHARIVARNAKLRRANRELRQHLELAAANIARLAIDNHQLRQRLEQAHRVTNIASRNTTG